MSKFITVIENGRERLVNVYHVTTVTPMVGGSALYGKGEEFPILSSTTFEEVKALVHDESLLHAPKISPTVSEGIVYIDEHKEYVGKRVEFLGTERKMIWSNYLTVGKEYEVMYSDSLGVYVKGGSNMEVTIFADKHPFNSRLQYFKLKEEE